ncbi:MAG: hypothetical protein AAF683_11840 [Pseudomonadota bacterium]
MNHPRILFLAATMAFGACSEVADDQTSQATTGASHKEHHHASTVKPGANVAFQTALREPLSPGDAGALEITMTEGHRVGTMTVTANAGDGLELFTTIDEETFDLSATDTHSWTVYFDTEDAGKYYINLHAHVQTPIGRLSRSYAAPIQVGTPEPKSNVSISQSSSNGEPVVFMEAAETIQQ